jgi:hypothetical protein
LRTASPSWSASVELSTRLHGGRNRDAHRRAADARPEIREIVDQTRAGREGDPAIRALLKATDEAGNSDWEQRLQGVELALAQAERLDGGSAARESTLLPGCRVIYPQ